MTKEFLKKKFKIKKTFTRYTRINKHTERLSWNIYNITPLTPSVFKGEGSLTTTTEHSDVNKQINHLKGMIQIFRYKKQYILDLQSQDNWSTSRLLVCLYRHLQTRSFFYFLYFPKRQEFKKNYLWRTLRRSLITPNLLQVWDTVRESHNGPSIFVYGTQNLPLQ